MKNLTNDKKTVAFTLAEVLITLGIIGIVAAITIPGLVANYQKTQHVSRLKKAYAEFNAALRQMTSDYGCSADLVCTGLFKYTGDGTETPNLGTALVKYFKVAKDCGMDTGKGCWSPKGYKETFDGSGNTHYFDDDSTTYKFLTANGMSLAIENLARYSVAHGDCGSNYSPDKSTGRNTGILDNVCAAIYIDTNGLQGPNYFGRDIHKFDITNSRGAMLYPEGGRASAFWWGRIATPLCSDNSTDKTGYACSGRIMDDGWEMNY